MINNRGLPISNCVEEEVELSAPLILLKSCAPVLKGLQFAVWF